MSTAGGTAPRPGRVRDRVRIGFAPGARTGDRVELLSWVGSVLLAVSVLPLALAVASVVATDVGARAAQQAADQQQVPAVLLEDAEVLAGTSTLRATAPVSWTSPDGVGHEDTVPVPVGRHAGDSVPVWIDPAGEHTSPPMDRGDVVVVTVTAGFLTLLVGLAAVVVVHASVCALLERGRQRAWTQEWAEVGPLWTARYRPR
ncbi:Rv1733c family protein [Geodermatophilus sp. FMUSA9-8]|uniref:Rv1733c family protein n=1 Tax=Geodermatophilus sp. FMUSA9-8 TaxID=3120155 RepID=UPI003009BB2C